jgi:hypothetical protein
VQEKGGGLLTDAPRDAWDRYDQGAQSADVAGAIDAALAEIESGSPTATPIASHVAGINPIPPAPGRAVPAHQDRPRAAGNGTTSPAQLRILDALAWQESLQVTESDRASVAFLAGASPTSSSYANNLGALRTAGLVEYRGAGRLALTAAGRKLATKPDRRLTHNDVMRGVLDKLAPAQGRLIQHIAKIYPKEIDRPALARAVGASHTSSSFANNLGRLRSLGLLIYRDGKVRADDRLYP